MSELLRWPCFLIALTTVLVSGWVHGLATGRWRPTHELTEASARVASVPLTVGDWNAEAQKVDDGEFRQAGAASYWVRRYTHGRTKESVLVILMCGRAGRMSVHTPEVCYQGAGFALSGTPEPFTFHWLETSTECSATFWTAEFRKTGSDPSSVRLIWGWNRRGDWQALHKPRWETEGEPFLYKMYISLDGQPAGARRAKPSSTSKPAVDLRRAQEFLQDFLPTLQKSLFPEGQETTSTQP